MFPRAKQQLKLEEENEKKILDEFPGICKYKSNKVNTFTQELKRRSSFFHQRNKQINYH